MRATVMAVIEQWDLCSESKLPYQETTAEAKSGDPSWVRFFAAIKIKTCRFVFHSIRFGECGRKREKNAARRKKTGSKRSTTEKPWLEWRGERIAVDADKKHKSHQTSDEQENDAKRRRKQNEKVATPPTNLPQNVINANSQIQMCRAIDEVERRNSSTR